MASRSRFWMVSAVTRAPCARCRAKYAAGAAGDHEQREQRRSSHFLRNTIHTSFEWSCRYGRERAFTPISHRNRATGITKLPCAVVSAGHDRRKRHIDRGDRPAVPHRPAPRQHREADREQPRPPQRKQIQRAEKARRDVPSSISGSTAARFNGLVSDSRT